MTFKHALIASVATLVLWAPIAVAQPSDDIGNGNFKTVAFKDMSSKLEGFTYLNNGGESLAGVAWLDYNNDGWLDLYLANGIGHDDALMRNNGDGTFTNVSMEAGLADGAGSSGVVVGDLNNDGFTDVFVVGIAGIFYNANTSPSRLFQNNGDGTFSNVTAESGLTLEGAPGEAMHASLADLDNDGLLDLFLPAPGSIPAQTQNKNKVFRNKGDFKFEDISATSGLDYGLGACVSIFTDYNRDGWQDLIVGDCGDIQFLPGTFHLFKNNGDLTFTEITTQVDLDTLNAEKFSAPRGLWMTAALGDYDNDSDMDLFATNAGGPMGQEHALFECLTNGSFAPVEHYTGIAGKAPSFGWSGVFGDFNNDGWEDITFAGAMMDTQFGNLTNPGYLFVNTGDKKFRQGSLPVDMSDKFTSGMAKADYNNDGYEDLAFAVGVWSGDAEGKPVLLENIGNGNRWLTVQLEGVQSNRSGVGARVKVELDGRVLTKEVYAGSSIFSSHTPWLTFGLNRAKVVNKITVYWPSGTVDEIHWLTPNQRITIVEGKGHFCL